ncbi:MAG: succinoglycan biosynthesis transporter [Candidatus Parcubacteria bacterium]|nr:MAG: succinoglycan biosynthesis transporter [Candidatus Parcubacteria bacterium]
MEILFENVNFKQTVLKNTFWLYLGNFISKVIKFLIIILSARYLGPENYGNFSYILAIIGIFFSFVDWGSGSLTIRDYQLVSDKRKLFNSFISFRLILLLISLFFIFSIFLLFKDFHSRLIALIIFIFTFISHLKYIITNIFQALKKMEYDGLSFIIENFSIFIFVVFLVRNFPDSFYLSLSYLIGIVISLIYCLFIFSKFFRLKDLHFVSDYFKYFLINGTPLLFFGILGFIFFSTDQIVLGYLRGSEEVGYYSLASKIIINLNLIISLFLASFLPNFSEIRDNKQRVLGILNKVLIYNFLIYFILITILILIPKNLLIFILGDNYAFTIDLLKFLAPFILLLSNITILDNILFVYNQQWNNFFITSICALLNLILNLILIPNYGGYGAGLATYISQLLNLILSFYLIRKIIFNRI